jgi:phage-related protein
MANMNQEELFSKVISGLQGMEEGTERTALATQLLGRGAVELGPLLNTSAEDTEAMRQKVHELGGVMSDEGVKAAAKYQDTLQDMKTGFDGLKRGLVSGFLPAVTEVMEGLTDIFSGNTSEGLKKISSGVDDMVKGISDALPKVVEVGTGIIESLAGAVINNAPKLFEAGMNLVFQLSTSIIENLPKLVTVALTLIQTFATGIADALPTLIPTIVDVVLQIVDILTQPDTLTNLLGAALQIIIALAEGLVEAIPKLADAVPKIIDNLTKFIQNNLDKIILAGIEITAKLAVGLIKALPSLVKAAVSLTTAIPKAIMTTDWLKVGSNIIHGIVKGLKDAGHAIKDFLLDLMKGAVDGVKKFFGIHSPSRKMRKEVGFQVGAGMALGIKDSASMVEDAMEGLETIPSTGKFGMNDFNVTGSSGYGSSNGGVSGIGGQTYIINVNQKVSTPDEMARAIRLESQYGLLEGGAI